MNVLESGRLEISGNQSLLVFHMPIIEVVVHVVFSVQVELRYKTLIKCNYRFGIYDDVYM